MFERGDRVVVEGFGKRRAILYVWATHPKGLTLCSEASFAALMEGREAPLVGFPLRDIVGRAESERATA